MHQENIHKHKGITRSFVRSFVCFFSSSFLFLLSFSIADPIRGTIQIKVSRAPQTMNALLLHISLWNSLDFDFEKYVPRFSSALRGFGLENHSGNITNHVHDHGFMYGRRMECFFVVVVVRLLACLLAVLCHFPHYLLTIIFHETNQQQFRINFTISGCRLRFDCFRVGWSNRGNFFFRVLYFCWFSSFERNIGFEFKYH